MIALLICASSLFFFWDIKNNLLDSARSLVFVSANGDHKIEFRTAGRYAIFGILERGTDTAKTVLPKVMYYLSDQNGHPVLLSPATPSWRQRLASSEKILLQEFVIPAPGLYSLSLRSPAGIIFSRIAVGPELDQALRSRFLQDAILVGLTWFVIMMGLRNIYKTYQLTENYKS